MFFGCLSGGRLGGIAAGIGFMLPGFILMLVASYVYKLVGFENRYVNASFRALQPLVAAMVTRILLACLTCRFCVRLIRLLSMYSSRIIRRRLILFFSSPLF